MSRELSGVIEQMYEVLLNDASVESLLLAEQIGSIQRSIPFTAPEAIGIRWRQVGAALYDAYGEAPSNEVEQEVVNIFMDIRPEDR